jgi:hypothetical protein
MGIGMQDVKIGDAVFDDVFVIKGNREGERPGIETVFGECGVELYNRLRYDRAEDLADLKSMFEMFGEALRQLRRIGSA